MNARDAIQHKENAADKKKIIKIHIYESQVENGRFVVPFEIDAGKYVVIEMADTGIGISPEVRKNIFDPFFTTKGNGKGTGLGLSTVYGIVKQNKAALDIVSSPGEGTTFRIFWPALDQKIDEADPVTKQIKINSGNETILVVEDDEQLRLFLNSVFSALGYQVLTAGNGEEAQRMAADHPHQIQLLFSDIIMPDINGHDLAKQFRLLNPEIKVLLTSGYTDERLIHKDENLNGFGFILKPFSARVLGEKVRQLLDS